MSMRFYFLFLRSWRRLFLSNFRPVRFSHSFFMCVKFQGYIASVIDEGVWSIAVSNFRSSSYFSYIRKFMSTDT